MKQTQIPSSIITVFLFSLLYWIYLASSTRMIICWDSLDYQALGRLLQNHGWTAYFKTGPNREPLYPWFVMLSMNLEAISGIAYTKVLAFLCVLVLGITQFLIYYILKRLNIRTGISALILAYFAISPAINNTAFSLYSEIAAIPFILLLLIANFIAYDCIQKGTNKDALYAGFILGLIFSIVTFAKGLFELIFFIYVLFYILTLLFNFFQGKKSFAIKSFLILFTFCTCFQIPLITYKFLNKHYNNHFALTYRGSWALYSSCARRAEKITPEKLLAALAYVPGKGFCEETLGPQKCYFWGTENLDSYGFDKIHELSQNTPPAMIDHKMLTLSIEKMMVNPAQFLLLMSFDGLKMFFWESTQIGFVSYPPWLQRLYDNHLLKNDWRAVTSLLSIMGFVYLTVLFFKRIPTFFIKLETSGTRNVDIVLIFLLLSSFVGSYALFDTTPRFALPVASLELITIALLADRLVTKFFQRSKEG